MMSETIREKRDDEKGPVNVFTHSSTGFPGAWTEEEIAELLSAWEEAVESLRPFVRRNAVVRRVTDILTNRNFRPVKREDISSQITKLTTEYKTYLGLLKIGIPAVKGSIVPQMERIFIRPRQVRRRRRRNTSTASVQASEDGENNRTESISQPENTEDESTTQARRRRFPRQNLQRLVQTLITQQVTLTEQLQNLFKKMEDSNATVIKLLGKLVNQKFKEKPLDSAPKKPAQSKKQNKKTSATDSATESATESSYERNTYMDAITLDD